jgi:uncharacterized protein involved in exopolysaccharide biosynthesis
VVKKEMEETQDSISINFGELWKIIWSNKLRIFLITSIFTGLGAIYAFTLKNEFVSEGKILPEFQGKSIGGLGNLAGLASLAGVDVSSAASGGADAIRPDLYPNVLQSTPFFLELLKQKIKTKDGKEVIFEKFYDEVIEDSDIDEEDKIQKFPEQKGSYITVSKYREETLKELRKRISSSIDKKTGVISINIKTPDPVVSASVAKYSMDYLTSYITTYRTDKAKRDLNFLEEQLQRAKGKYYANQERKAQYGDGFQLGTIKLQSADIQRERIESEYKQSSGFYNNILQEYEKAKLKLQQETPVFKILEPPVVANLKSEPKRVFLILLIAFIGTVLSLFLIIINRNNYKKIF